MTTNVGDIYYEISADVAPLLQGQREADKALDSMEQSFNKTTKAADTLDTGLSKLTSAIKGVIAASALREMAEMVQKYQEMAERVQMATSSQSEFLMVQQRLLATANGTYRSLQEAQELYIRTADSLRSMQYTTSQAIDVQDSMSYAFVKNATSADRAGAAIDAFSKSINTGKVAADQWETLTTAIPSVINDIAAASKMTGAEVRALGAAGQLTAKQLTEGLRQSLEENSAAAAGMSNNLVDASVRIKTAITQILVAFESETGVVQGFTNGLISSADAMLKFSQNSEKIKDVIDASTTAALVFAGVIGARYVGAITAGVAAKLQSISASRQQILADGQSSQAALVSANATLRKSVADKEAAMSSLALAQAEYNVAKGSSAEMLAMNALVAAKTRATAAAIENKLAEDAQAAASTRAAAAARAASVSIGLARGALTLIGGPAGAAMLAATAIYYFWQKSQQAREEAIAFADGLDKLNASMKSMSNTSLRGSISDSNEAIKGLGDVVSSLTDEIADLTAERDNYIQKGKQFGTTAEQGNGLLIKAAELTDRINQKTRDLSENQEKLNRTTQARNDMQSTLNNNMLTSMGVHDRLIEKGTVLEQVQGAVAKAFGATANEIIRANQAGQNFNPRSLEISPATPAGDKLILSLEEQNELLKIQDERLRAVTKAGMEQAKVTNNPNQIAKYKRLAGENFDLQKAEEARKKAASEAASQGKRDAGQAESIAQKLANLKQQSELAAGSTQELSREQSILNAQQSLGKAATQEQIALAGQYAAKTWDVANALKMRQQAEQASKFVNQEIAAAKTSKNPITGVAEDPNAQIDQQEQQKLLALQKYQEMGVLNVQQFEDAKTAIQMQATNARLQIVKDEADQQSQAISTILGSASQGFDGLANLIAGAAGKNNAAYAAMFALSKGFAIAQGMLNLQVAISNAMASGPYPANLAAMASVASAGGQLLSTIGSISYSGAREHGGPVSANSMYRVGEGGKPEIFKASNGSQYMIPGDNGSVISNRDMQGGGGAAYHYSPTIQINGNPDDKTIALVEAAVARGGKKVYQQISGDLASGKGNVSKGLQSGWTTKRRTG